jgi:hypothetical protein
MTTREPRTLCEIAASYKIDPRTLKKWLAEFLPDLKRPAGTYIYTPDQVKQIIEACGEFAEK